MKINSKTTTNNKTCDSCVVEFPTFTMFGWRDSKTKRFVSWSFIFKKENKK